jgi:DNA-binding CsgD family transcriptional regulator
MNMKYLEQSPKFLETVLEGFVDGILVVNDHGETLYSNTLAQQICHQLNATTPPVNNMPGEVWRACQALIENRELYAEHAIVLESLVTLPATTIRIRVQWLELSAQTNLLLVRLEDQQQMLRNLAIAESKQYGLTNREAEVWLLRRLGHSRKAIADQLYITLDTVKKHLKNIYAKQQSLFDEGDWRSKRVS